MLDGVQKLLSNKLNICLCVFFFSPFVLCISCSKLPQGQLSTRLFEWVKQNKPKISFFAHFKEVKYPYSKKQIMCLSLSAQAHSGSTENLFYLYSTQFDILAIMSFCVH